MNLNDAKNSDRHVFSEGWDSVRLLLTGDAMGFSFHITTIYKGAELPMHYKNHLEAVYCISGEGSIENCASGEVHEIQPDRTSVVQGQSVSVSVDRGGSRNIKKQK